MSNKSSDFAVKRYYVKTERYDWVNVVDHFKGIESFFHLNRKRVMFKLFCKYGVGSRSLDVGCGTGLLLRELPVGTIGLDINPWAVRMAKKHVPNVEVVVGDAEKLPFRDKVFSTIICTESLEHMPKPKKALKEIYRILQHGGKLIGSVPNKSIFWKFRCLSSTCPRTEPFHNEYRINQVVQFLKNFRVLKVSFSIFRMNIIFVGMKILFTNGGEFPKK